MNEKQWNHFHNGIHISNRMINSWLNELRNGYFIYKYEFNTMSSGDTTVIFFKWKTCFEFIVANSSGTSKLVFYNDEEETLRQYYFNYTRTKQ